MMDIIVTTPKGQMANAAKEAADCIAAGGGEYFRRFHSRAWPRRLNNGDRVYYVEEGYIRGFAIVSRLLLSPAGQTCDTTGRVWAQGFFVFMDAVSWRWIKPFPMRGFQGFRYVPPFGPSTPDRIMVVLDRQWCTFEVVGGWQDTKPSAASACSALNASFPATGYGLPATKERP